jgi:lysyl-tRNA synthetase class 2
MHADDTWDDVFFRIMFDRIEHRLSGEGRRSCAVPDLDGGTAKPGDAGWPNLRLYVCGVEA